MVLDLNTYEVAIGKNLFRGYLTPESDNSLIHFIHGTGFCSLTYWPFLKHFRHQHSLFLHDVQGHGESESRSRFVGWNGSAEQALKVMAAHESLFDGTRPVMGVGHSFGAIVTLLMAAAEPSRFKGLILLDPVIFPKDQLKLMAIANLFGLLKFNRMARQARHRTKSWPNRAAAVKYLRHRGIFKGWAEASLMAYIDYGLKRLPDGSYALKCRPEMEAALFSTFPKKLWAHIEALQVPTIIVRGDRGYKMLKSTVTQAAALNEHISVEVVRGGHCFMQEAPEHTAIHVKRLMARIR